MSAFSRCSSTPSVKAGLMSQQTEVLQLGGTGDEGKQGRERLRETGDQNDVLIALAEMLDDAVAAHAVIAELAGTALPDHPKTMSVVDVEQRAMVAGDGRELAKVGGVAGHAVDSVHADELGLGAVGRH